MCTYTTWAVLITENGCCLKVSPKADVYSYGIILLELITGKKPTDSMFDGASNLLSWVQSHFPNDIATMLDTVLTESPEIHGEAFHVVRLALLCTKEHPDERPTMNDVLHLLEIIKPKQIGSDP